MTEIVISDEFACDNDRVQEELRGMNLTSYLDDEYVSYLDDKTFVVVRGSVILEDGNALEVDLSVTVEDTSDDGNGFTLGVQRGEADPIVISDDCSVVFGLSSV